MLKNHWNTIKICLLGQTTTKHPLSATLSHGNPKNTSNFEGCVPILVYKKKCNCNENKNDNEIDYISKT